MDFLEQPLAKFLNTFPMLNFNFIIEPADNSLRITVDIGPRDEVETQLGIEKVTAYKRYDIMFNHYIIYSVQSEQYARLDESEVWEGKSIRVYSQSQFINYSLNSMNIYSLEDADEERKHYQIICAFHIIDVISYRPPSIQGSQITAS